MVECAAHYEKAWIVRYISISEILKCSFELLE